MPRARRHLRRAAQGAHAAQDQVRRKRGRDQGAGHLHGRLPAHDRQRHLHHQRRRARRRLPAGALARRVLHRRGGPDQRPRPVHGQADPVARRLARVRDRQPRRHVGQGRPQAQDPGHHAAARPAARRARVHRRRARAPTRRSWRCSRASTRAATTASSSRRSTRTRPATPRRRCSSSIAACGRRPAERGQRALAAELAVLQLPPLRPGQGRPLQGQQAPRAADATSPCAS